MYWNIKKDDFLDYKRKNKNYIKKKKLETTTTINKYKKMHVSVTHFSDLDYTQSRFFPVKRIAFIS